MVCSLSCLLAPRGNGDQASEATQSHPHRTSTKPKPRHVSHRTRDDAHPLGVIVLDATTVVGPVAANRPVPLEAGHEATASARGASGRGAVALQAHAEENGGDEEGGPGTPDETKGVAAEGGRAAVILEGVAGLNEDSAEVGVSDMQ